MRLWRRSAAPPLRRRAACLPGLPGRGSAATVAAGRALPHKPGVRSGAHGLQAGPAWPKHSLQAVARRGPPHTGNGDEECGKMHSTVFDGLSSQ